MQRDINALQAGAFDLLVIGGGIYGSWLALHAAVAGRRVALVERSDWAAATSSASSKLLHGGLRYLERYEFGLVKKSLHERRELFRLMPHQVRPLRFLLPVYRHSRVGRWRLKAGLTIYDWLAGRDQPVDGHVGFSAEQLCEQEPALSPDELTGGFSYGDCGTDDGRMVLEIVESAIQAGAVACNYVSADTLLTKDGRITGATLRDHESGHSFDVAATVVVNAAGPWVFRQFGLESELPTVRLTKGVHLVMPCLTDHAVLLTAKEDGRVFFLIPWYGRTLLGTTDTDFEGDPAKVQVEAQDIDYLLRAANNYLRVGWTIDDVHAAFCGLRTLQNDPEETASGVSREWAIQEVRPGLLSSVGGKYTSARVDAAEAFRIVQTQLPGPVRATAQPRPMAWYPPERYSDFERRMLMAASQQGLDSATAAAGVRRFGAKFQEILKLVENDSDLGSRIVFDLPFCRAEVVHAAKHEMARTLVDVLRRRIPLMLLTRLSEEVLRDAAQLMATVTGWTEDQQELQVQQVVAACELTYGNKSYSTSMGTKLTE